MKTLVRLTNGLVACHGQFVHGAGSLAAQLMHHGYRALTQHFIFVWLFSLFVIVAGGLLFSHYWQFQGSTSDAQGSRRSECRWRLQPADSIAMALLVACIVAYVALIFYKEDFAYYDDDMLTDFSVQGHNFPAPIWPETGRFYPLADQEFNLLKVVTRSPLGYHSLVAVEMALLVVVLFLALRQFKVRYRALILFLVLSTPSFVIPFTGFVYPERNVLFWLAIMVLCLGNYAEKRTPFYFIGCLVAAHCALYYKEPVVLFVGGCAVTRLLLDMQTNPRSGWASWRTVVKENSVSVGMLVVTAIYVVLFLMAIVPYRNFSYVAEHREALSTVLLACLQVDWLPFILMAVLLVRIGWAMLLRGQLDPVWEPLGVGALAYFVGIVALKLSSGYYMAPADFIAILYLAHLSLVWFAKPTKPRIALMTVACALIVLHNLAYSSVRVIERKGVIASKSQLAEFLKQYKGNSTGEAIEVFFPYANNYHLMGISSYLRYKGFELAGEGAASPGSGPRIVVEGPGEFNNGRCVDYRDYICVHREEAPARALIVVLPDDEVSASDVDRAGQKADRLLSLKACVICADHLSWFRSLHAISAEFWNRPLPEHWLQLDIFRKSVTME